MTPDAVNTHYVPVLSDKEIQPVNVTLVTFSAAEILAGLVVNTAKRYNTSNPADPGTDVSTLVSISGAVITVSNLWLNSDTPADGEYQVEIVVKNSGGSRREETNLVYRIM